MLHDSGFADANRRSATVVTSESPALVPGDKENASPNKRARKSLVANWTPHDISRLHDSSLTNPETPSKSLVGDNSIQFTPPSILKESLNDSAAHDSSPRDGLQNLSTGSGLTAGSGAALPGGGGGGSGGVADGSRSPPKSKVRDSASWPRSLVL